MHDAVGEVLVDDYLSQIMQSRFHSGKLNQHLDEIDEACEERMELLTQQMAKREDVTEALKTDDQMEWVRRMNNIRNRAEEVVLHDLVYC